MTEQKSIPERLRSSDSSEALAGMDELEELLRRKDWKEPIPRDLETLLGSEDPQIRMKALWLIGKFAQNKVPSTYPIDAVTSLCADSSEETRENAAWAIGEIAALGIGGAGQVACLVSLLEDESSPVRGMAAWALGRLAERRALRQPEAEAKLRSLLQDRSEYVKKTAAWALERF